MAGIKGWIKIVRYTFDGCEFAETVIGNHQGIISRRVRDSLPGNVLAAIVLIGGYGRREGAYVVEGNKYQPYNDYDYFLIFKNVSRRRARNLAELIPDLESLVGIAVDFFPLVESELGSLEFSLMNAEMQTGHRVIWGNPDILAAMQSMPLAEVPLREFSRMMMNRGCLLLMNYRDPGNPEFSKFINKAWLAVGDSVLRLNDVYDISYLVKARKLWDVTGNTRIALNFEKAVNIRLRPDLHPAWTIADLQEVTTTWSQTLSRLAAEDKHPLRLLPGEPLLLLTHFLRNIRDPRLHSWSHVMFQHPRQSVLATLKALLADRQAEGWNHKTDILLKLWASYS